jgi:hypothetical protein
MRPYEGYQLTPAMSKQRSPYRNEKRARRANPVLYSSRKPPSHKPSLSAIQPLLRYPQN